MNINARSALSQHRGGFYPISDWRFYISWGNLCKRSDGSICYINRIGRAHTNHGGVMKYNFTFEGDFVDGELIIQGSFQETGINPDQSDNNIQNTASLEIDNELFVFVQYYDSSTSTHFSLGYFKESEGYNVFHEVTPRVADSTEPAPFGKWIEHNGQYYSTMYFRHANGDYGIDLIAFNGTSYTWTEIYKGTFHINEATLEKIGSDFVLLIRNGAAESTGALVQITSEDLINFTAPTRTNLGVGVCNADLIYNNGKVHVVYMDRADGTIRLSKNNDISIIDTPLSYNEPEVVYTAFDYGHFAPIIGYPSIIHISNNNYLLVFTAEETAGERVQTFIKQITIN